jgi:hypothetical protein
LERNGVEAVALIESPRQWEDGEKVRTSYGIGVVKGFYPIWDLYDVELDWRPLDEQVKEYEDQEAVKKEAAEARGTLRSLSSKITDRNAVGATAPLQTVVEEDDESNYMSPATSFDASKRSSKQSLTGIDQTGRLTPAPIDEENPVLLPPTQEDSPHEFIFDADAFDRKAVTSPQPTLDETIGTSSIEEGSVAKPTSLAASPVPSSVTAKGRTSQTRHIGKYSAKIHGRDLHKYVPPSLPKLEKDDRSKFSFWATDSVKSAVSDTNVDKSKATYSPGERVTTPYGLGIVFDHRQKSRIVVVDMSGPWSARAYLQDSIIKREDFGLLGNVLRRFSTAQTSPKRKSSGIQGANERVPHVAGTTICTPFGEGIVVRPLPPVTPSSSPKKVGHVPESSARRMNTVAISLTSWTLRDGSHPTLYTTADNAEKWRHKSGHHRESSLFSVLGSIVSGTVESLKKIRVPRETETPIKIEGRKFERYYKDGAAVTTAYGDGTVRAFRESDGCYIVSLLMKTGKSFATAYLREDSMSYRLARGCIEGYPVLTTFGSGVLQSVNPTTGVHTVIIPSFGAVCYLQPSQVLRPLKAAVGEDVSTPYGEGRVCKYRLPDNVYEVKLETWGNNAMLFAKAETFDRIDDRLEDKGGFGVGWILRFFYSREEGKEEGAQRSRTNSFSMLSESGASFRFLR